MDTNRFDIFNLKYLIDFFPFVFQVHQLLRQRDPQPSGVQAREVVPPLHRLGPRAKLWEHAGRKWILPLIRSQAGRQHGLPVSRLPPQADGEACPVRVGTSGAGLLGRQGRVLVQDENGHDRHQVKVHAAQEGVPFLVQHVFRGQCL